MGDMPPLSGQHHVYMIGAFAGFTNAASGLPLNDWDGGTAADRYEPAKMTFLSNLWFKGYVIELTPRVSNYASPLYMYFVNNKGTIEFAHGGDIGEIWENVGNQLSGTDSNLITWAAGAMTGCNNASYPGLEYLLCYEGSTLVVDLASAGGWQVDQPEGTFVEVTLTIKLDWRSRQPYPGCPLGRSRRRQRGPDRQRALDAR